MNGRDKLFSGFVPLQLVASRQALTAAQQHKVWVFGERKGEQAEAESLHISTEVSLLGFP